MLDLISHVHACNFVVISVEEQNYNINKIIMIINIDAVIGPF